MFGTTKRYAPWLVGVLAGLLMLAGCQNAEQAPAGNDAAAQLNVGGKFSAVLTQLAATNADSAMPMFTATDVITGQLAVTNAATGVTETFSWNAYLDAATLDVQSTKTIAVFPGTYDLSLLLTRGNQQYAGEVLGQVLADGMNTVSMTIRPVIGDTVDDVTVVQRLADFRFSYDPAELAAFAGPQLGISIDGGAEMVFAVNPLTGISDAYVNLPLGLHDIHLNFYNGGLLIGRSLVEQESVNVVPGLPVAMDLVSLHAETMLALTEVPGEARFNFTIPAEVVDEAGGVANLQTTFQIVGPENPYQEAVLTLTPAGGNYAATATLTGFQFGVVSMSLVFDDVSGLPAEHLGTCTNTGITLDSIARTVNCQLTLRRRSVISGNLLTTVGVNVWNSAGEPAPGAVIYANGTSVGIAGNSGGTPGYAKFYLVAGSYTLRAEDATHFGEVTETAAALGLINQNISLNTLILTDADADGFLSDVDCNDSNSTVYPGAPGTGLGIDNNCDGTVSGDEITLGTVTVTPAGIVARHEIRNLDLDGDGAADDLRVSRIRFTVATAGTFIFDSLVWEATGVDLNGDGEITGFDNYMILLNSAGAQLAANDDYSTVGPWNLDGSVHSYDSVIGIALAPGTYTLAVSQLSYPANYAMAGYQPNRPFNDYMAYTAFPNVPPKDHGDWQLTISSPDGGIINATSIMADGAPF